MEQNAKQGEARRQLGSFSKAFEHAKALELSRKPINSCIDGVMSMKVDETAGRKSKFVLEVARSDAVLCGNASDVLPSTDGLSCGSGKLDLEKPMMDEVGLKPVPLSVILHPEVNSSKATPAHADHSSVIGCNGYGPSNGN